VSGQASLDDYVRNGEYVEEASMFSVGAGECGFCRLRDKWFKLHPGAIYLYMLGMVRLGYQRILIMCIRTVREV